MEYNGTEMRIAFREDTPVDPARIIALSREKSENIRFTPDNRLIVSMRDLAAADIVGRATDLLSELEIEEPGTF